MAPTSNDRRLVFGAVLALAVTACSAEPTTDDEATDLQAQVDDLEAQLEAERERADQAEEELEELRAGDAPEAEPDDADADDPEAADDGQIGSDRDQPVPAGERATIAGWDIAITDVTPDATDAVLEANQFNDPPADGRQFFMVTLEAEFTGEGVDDDSGDLWIDVRQQVVDDNQVTYSASDDRCGVIPDDIDDAGETFVGGTLEGNVCWEVDSDQMDTLVVFMEPTFAFDDQRWWFEVPDAG